MAEIGNGSTCFFFSFFLLLFLLGRLNVYLIFEEDLRASFH